MYETLISLNLLCILFSALKALMILKPVKVSSIIDKIINGIEKINPKKIPIEKRIIHQFIAENNKGLSFIMLKNEIQKAFELSKFIAEYFDKVKDKKKLDLHEISEGLQEAYKTKISPVYLNFLFEIVENYFLLFL